jgi:hypothetical protein
MKLIVLCVSFLLISCSTVTSSRIGDQHTEGISYFLPIRLHKVKLTANLTPADELNERKAKDAFGKAAEARKKAKEECDAAESEYKKAEQIANNAVGEEAKKEAEKQKALVLANLQVKKNALGEACIKEAEAYEKLRKALEPTEGASQDKCNYQVKFSVEPQALVPDHNYGFVARLKHNPLRADALKLATTDTGLLSSGESVSTDTTGSILAKLAQAIISFGVQIPVPSPELKALVLVPRTEEGQRKPCPKSLEIDSIVDMSNQRDIDKLNCRLRDIDAELEICGYRIDENRDEPKGNPPLQKGSNPPQGETEEYEGLFYRRELPYLARLRDLNDGNKIVADALVLMPNLSPITRVDFPAGIFVTTKQKVGFNNGMLVSYDTERPSEVLGLASIPADIAQSIINAASQLFKFRLDYSSSQLEQAKKQSELIDVLNEMLKKMNK